MNQPTGVNNIFGLLDEDEIGLIGTLADNLDRSGLDLLELDIQGLRVSLAKTTHPDTPPQEAVPSAAPTTLGKDTLSENTVAITAPVIGFYRAQNVSGPIVEVGARVAKDTAIGAISQINGDWPALAGVDGIVAELCVENDQFVEYGQILGRVRRT